jgi:hypothetical protein
MALTASPPLWKPLLWGTLLGVPLGITVAGTWVYTHAHRDDPYPHA